MTTSLLSLVIIQIHVSHMICHVTGSGKKNSITWWMICKNLTPSNTVILFMFYWTRNSNTGSNHWGTVSAVHLSYLLINKILWNSSMYIHFIVLIMLGKKCVWEYMMLQLLTQFLHFKGQGTWRRSNVNLWCTLFECGRNDEMGSIVK